MKPRQAAIEAILDHVAPRPGPPPNPMFDLLRHHPVLRHYASNDGSLAMPAEVAADWVSRGILTEEYQLAANFNEKLTTQDIIKGGFHSDPPVFLRITEATE